MLVKLITFRLGKVQFNIKEQEFLLESKLLSRKTINSWKEKFPWELYISYEKILYRKCMFLMGTPDYPIESKLFHWESNFGS